jgi:hypothetical protein
MFDGNRKGGELSWTKEGHGPAVEDYASGIAGGRRRSPRRTRGIRDTGPADTGSTWPIQNTSR